MKLIVLMVVMMTLVACKAAPGDGAPTQGTVTLDSVSQATWKGTLTGADGKVKQVKLAGMDKRSYEGVKLPADLQVHEVEFPQTNSGVLPMNPGPAQMKITAPGTWLVDFGTIDANGVVDTTQAEATRTGP